MTVVSAVLMLPAAERGSGDALSIALGHADDGVSTYSVPFCPIGGGDPTHYACHAWVTDRFRAMIEAAQQGSYPDWPPEMLSLAQSVIGGLVSSFAPVDANPAEHFASVAAAQGLTRFVSDIEA